MTTIRYCLVLLLSMASALAQTPTAPAQPPPVIDHVTLQLSDNVAFTIPITDRKWLAYRAYLPSLSLNSRTWDTLNQTMGRTDLEMRLHDEIAKSYLATVAAVRKQNAPLVEELTQAAVVAQRPGATPAQIARYNQINAKDAPILNQTTRPLMAIRLLLLAMQQDIHLDPGYSGLYNGKVVPKPGTNPAPQ